MEVGQFPSRNALVGCQPELKKTEGLPLYAPGTQFLIKVWKDGPLKAQFEPTYEGLMTYQTFYPYSSLSTRARLLCTPLLSQAMEGKGRHPVHL